MKSTKEEILERNLKRQVEARKITERIFEERSLELFKTSEELKKVNAKLKDVLNEKDTQLKSFFENINDAYLVIDLNGNVLKMNDIAKDYFGYSLQDNLNVANIIFKEDSEYAQKSFKELIKKGKFTDYTARIVTKKKEVKWVNINAITILDKFKKPVAAQGIVRDITEQVEKQLVLDVVNNVAKSILGKEDIVEIAWEISSTIANYLHTSDCVIYLIDKQNNLLEQIAAFGAKNKNSTIKNKITIPIGSGIVGSVAKTGISEIISDTSKDKRYIVDDEIRLSEITIPIINDGEVIGVIDAEHQRKNYFNDKQLKTVENIANLVSLQLKSAINLRERKKAEQRNKELLEELTRSNEELKEYAHIVSHDLKSPLRSISALSSWIKMDNLECFNEESLQNFEDLDMTLEKMDSLISNILKFSKLDIKDKEDEKVDFNTLIDDLLHILYIPSNIEIKVLNKLPIINGDKIKFQQIFQNLLSNAIKFNDKENGLITINVENEHSFYKFTIEDNGIGIEKRHFDKIFKIFQSLKKSKDSTGVGLSIVKKIINLYGGEIWLKSEINKGTTFYFTIKK